MSNYINISGIAALGGGCDKAQLPVIANGRSAAYQVMIMMIIMKMIMMMMMMIILITRPGSSEAPSTNTNATADTRGRRDL